MKVNTKYIIGGVLIAAFLVIWHNSKKAKEQPNNGGSHLPNTSKYPDKIDISKVPNFYEINCFVAPCPQPEFKYGNYWISKSYDSKLNKDVYSLSNGSSGGALPIYDSTTGVLIGHNYIVAGNIKTDYI
jgi:hypothetical protein